MSFRGRAGGGGFRGRGGGRGGYERLVPFGTFSHVYQEGLVVKSSKQDIP